MKTVKRGDRGSVALLTTDGAPNNGIEPTR